RAAARLREAGVTVAVLDLTGIGQNVTPEQWYEGLLIHLGQQLRLEDELDDYWLDHERMGPLQRFMGAVREVTLPALTPGPSPNPGRGENQPPTAGGEPHPPGLGG